MIKAKVSFKIEKTFTCKQCKYKKRNKELEYCDIEDICMFCCLDNGNPLVGKQA